MSTQCCHAAQQLLIDIDIDSTFGRPWGTHDVLSRLEKKCLDTAVKVTPFPGVPKKTNLTVFGKLADAYNEN